MNRNNYNTITNNRTILYDRYIPVGRIVRNIAMTETSASLYNNIPLSHVELYCL